MSPLPQGEHIRAVFQPPTAFPCLFVVPNDLDTPTGQCPSMALSVALLGHSGPCLTLAPLIGPGPGPSYGLTAWPDLRISLDPGFPAHRKQLSPSLPSHNSSLSLVNIASFLRSFFFFFFLHVIVFVHTKTPQSSQDLFMAKYWHTRGMRLIIFNFVCLQCSCLHLG